MLVELRIREVASDLEAFESSRCWKTNKVSGNIPLMHAPPWSAWVKCQHEASEGCFSGTEEVHSAGWVRNRQ